MSDLKTHYRHLKEQVASVGSSSCAIDCKTWYTVYRELFRCHHATPALSPSSDSSSRLGIDSLLLFPRQSGTENVEESEETIQRRTRPWYYDTPTYALPNLRRQELSIYPDEPSATLPEEPMPKSPLSSPLYQSIVYYKKSMAESIIFLALGLRAIVDAWIDHVEKPVRNRLWKRAE